MEPPYTIFQHIDIRACWPASEDTLHAYEQQVTPRGCVRLLKCAYDANLLKTAPLDAPVYTYLTSPFDQVINSLFDQPSVPVAGTRLNMLGILQVCLLLTPPFQGCEDEHIWALHYSPPEAFRCQNRPALIEHLADALLEYEWALRVYTQKAQALPKLAKQTVKNAEVIAEACSRLRRSQRANTTAPRLPRAQGVTKFLQTLRSMEQALSTDYHRQLEKPKSFWRSRQVARMFCLFEQYGPSYKDYRDTAVYQALAAILLQLGIEEGEDREVVAARLRVRRARRKKPPIS